MGAADGQGTGGQGTSGHGGAAALARRAMSGGLAGRGAGALKYDVLTALMVHAHHGAEEEARLAARLCLLVTARYDWRAGTFSVAVLELAKLWGVTDRTAKRVLAALRERGWIETRRPAARGRVAVHGIVWPRVLAATRPAWAAVGPDFAARMAAPEAAPETTVVPFRRPELAAAAAPAGETWPALAALLAERHPGSFAAWFARLSEAGEEGGALVLAAPSAFVASHVGTHLSVPLRAALAAVRPDLSEVRLVVRPG